MAPPSVSFPSAVIRQVVWPYSEAHSANFFVFQTHLSLCFYLAVDPLGLRRSGSWSQVTTATNDRSGSCVTSAARVAATRFARSADDVICHCKSAEEAQALWSALADRFAACKLVLHPEKTKIVYCKDKNRRGGVEGIALAEEAAAGDVSDSAKTRVIEALDFRHAFTQMDGLLANASAGVWRELARRGRLERMRDEATRLRIVREKRQLADAAPRRRRATRPPSEYPHL